MTNNKIPKKNNKIIQKTTRTTATITFNLFYPISADTKHLKLPLLLIERETERDGWSKRLVELGT
jgi:hypothetical protein